MVFHPALVITFLSLCSNCVCAQLPHQELKVETRELDVAAEASEGYRVGAAASKSSWSQLTLLVRNGEKSALRLHQSVPLQWIKSAQSQNSNLKVAGAEVFSRGGGVTQDLHWFDVGQSMTVTPKWPGGKKDVTLEIEVQQADMQTAQNADVPRQTRNQLNTTVSVPLNTWVTIAASGKGPAPAGSYSSEVSTYSRSLLQVRVTAP